MSITESNRIVHFKAQQNSRMPGSATLKRGATAAARHKHFLLGGITSAIGAHAQGNEISLERSFLQEHNRAGVTRKGGRYGEDAASKGMISSVGNMGTTHNTSTDRQAAPRLTQEMKSRALMAGSSSCSPLKNFENLQRFRSNLPQSRNSTDRQQNPPKVQSTTVLENSNLNKLYEVSGKSRQAPQQTLLSATNSGGRKQAIVPPAKQNFSSIEATTSGGFQGLTSRSGANDVNNKMNAMVNYTKPSLATIRPNDVKQSLVESTSSLRISNNNELGLRNSRSTKNSHLLYQGNSAIANNYMSNQSVSSPPVTGSTAVPKTAAVSHRGPTMTSKLSKYMQQRQTTSGTNHHTVAPTSHTTIIPERMQSLAVNTSHNQVSSAQSTPMRERPPATFGSGLIEALNANTSTPNINVSSSLGPIGANSGQTNRKGGHKQPRQVKGATTIDNPSMSGHIHSQIYLGNGDEISPLIIRNQTTEVSPPESAMQSDMVTSDEANRQSILNFSKRVREQTLMHLSTAAQANQLYQQHHEVAKSVPRQTRAGAHAENSSSLSSVRRQVKKAQASHVPTGAALLRANSISSPSYIKIVGPGSTILARADLSANNPQQQPQPPQLPLQQEKSYSKSSARSHSQANKGNKIATPRLRDASANGQQTCANKSVSRRYQVPVAKSQRGKSSDPNLDGVSSTTALRGDAQQTTTSHTRLNTSFKATQPPPTSQQGFLSNKRQAGTVAPVTVAVNISISPQRKRHNDLQAAKAYGGNAAAQTTSTKHGTAQVSVKSSISVYQMASKQNNITSMYNNSKHLSIPSAGQNKLSKPMFVNTAKQQPPRGLIDLGASPDKRPTMSKSQANQATGSRPAKQQTFQRRYLMGSGELTRANETKANQLNNRNRRQNGPPPGTKAANGVFHPYNAAYSKSPAKKVYSSNVQHIATHMINVSTRKNQPSKTRPRPPQAPASTVNQSFRGPESTPQIDSSRTDNSKEDTAPPHKSARGTYEEQEQLYRKRQDEIVKKIQSNIKRSEELDNLAEQNKKRHEVQLQAKKEKEDLSDLELSKRQASTIPVVEAFSKAVMSINDNFSNLSQLLSPKTNDAVPSAMPPNLALKQRHFLFNRDAGGSGRNTPENMFVSQEGEEERPVSVGDHLRIDMPPAGAQTDKHDEYEILSMPPNDQTVDADQTVVQILPEAHIIRATGPISPKGDTALFGPQGIERLEIQVANADTSSIAVPASGHATPPSAEPMKQELNIDLPSNQMDTLNDELQALQQEPERLMVSPVAKSEDSLDIIPREVTVEDDDEILHSEEQKSPTVDLDKRSEIEAAEITPKLPQLPLAVDDFVMAYEKYLHYWEMQELKEGKYETVYYAGEIMDRLDQSHLQKEDEQPCFDDDDGYYKFVLNQHMSYRYEVLKMLGKGSFAQVVSVLDHKTGLKYALKINRNTEIDHKFAEQEAALLKFLMKEDPHDEANVVRMLEHIHFRQHQCFFFELLYTDLFEFLKEHDFKGFPEEQIRVYTKQLLTSLAFLEQHEVIHCDLKPENILLTDDGCQGLKVVDFGSGCFRDQQVYTYVQSRFYRSPEVILRIPYTEKVDMWSLGCILAELFTGEPLFPGNNEQEQLEYIMEVKGIPSDSMIDKSRKKEHYFDTDYSPFLIEDEDYGILRIPEDRKLRIAVPSGDRVFIDFLNRALELDPEERMSAEEALHHPWITEDEAATALVLQAIQSQYEQEQDFTSEEGYADSMNKETSLMQLAMFHQQEGLEVIEQDNDEDEDNEQIVNNRKQQNSSQHSNVTASFISGEVYGQNQTPDKQTPIKLDQSSQSVDQIANCFSLSVTDAKEPSSDALLEPAIISSPQKQQLSQEQGLDMEELLIQQQQIQQNSPEKEATKFEVTYFKKQAGRRKKQNI